VKDFSQLWVAANLLHQPDKPAGGAPCRQALLS
jgi:hypothetical protein